MNARATYAAQAPATPATPAAPAAAAQGSAPTRAERVFVKWATPEEELVSTAKLAFALVDRRIAKPARIAIAAPNRNWAAQAVAAARCVAADLPELHAGATLCVAQPALAARTQEALRALDAAAAAGTSTLRGRSLAHHLGLHTVPQLEHALLHLQGDEDAAALAALAREQLARPTVPAASPAVPVMLADALQPDIDYLFMVGCVEGLMQSSAVFWNAVRAGRVRTTISCFQQAPYALALAAGIAFARCKQSGGVRMALAQPTHFLAEAGHVRPTTEGGQALLRTYRLN